MVFTRIVVSAILVLLISQVASHSFLLHPFPDWTNERKPECRIGNPTTLTSPEYIQNCHGPCGSGERESNGGIFFNPNQGSTTMKRGEKMYMKWTKNNHQSGFVRFTLVPRSQRMDKNVHDKYAFHYACWEAGEINCQPNEFCSTDLSRKRYQTEVEIPHVFPDGKYTLGWSWYGGTSNYGNGPVAEYADYWSCANIIIAGSVDNRNVADSFVPVFKTGMANNRDTCLSAVNRLGICTREPCSARYPASYQKPAQFANGATPFPILASDLGYNGATSQYGASPVLAPANQNDLRAWISHFELVNTNTGATITSDFSKSVYVGNVKDSLSIRAVTQGNIKMVDFRINGRSVHTEGSAPYYIAGDFSNTIRPWKSAILNEQFTIQAQAIGNDGSQDIDTVRIRLHTDPHVSRAYQHHVGS
jgi:hypothetical protein